MFIYGDVYNMLSTSIPHKARNFRQGLKYWFVYWYLYSKSYSTNLGKHTMFY